MGELAARTWDVLVVGGGHNGLTAAAYLARAGQSRARPRAAGSTRWRVHARTALPGPGLASSARAPIWSACCTRPWWTSLTCAGGVTGWRWSTPTSGALFPTERSIALWDDADRSAAAVAELSPADVDGYRAYSALFDRMRRALREGDRDVWVGEAPGRPELRELLAGDPEAIEVLFHASIADVVERHVRDERLRTALHGQGTDRHLRRPSRPRHRRHPPHACLRRTSRARPGRGDTSMAGWAGCPSPWPTRPSKPGRRWRRGSRWRPSCPGEGVRLEGGEMIRAPCRGVERRPEAHPVVVRGRRARGLPQPGRRPGGQRARSRRSTAGCPGFPAFPRPRRRASPIGP